MGHTDVASCSDKAPTHHALGVNGAQVGVLEQRDQVRLLQRQDGRDLEAQVVLEVLRDLPDTSLKLDRQTTTTGETHAAVVRHPQQQQQITALLVAATLAQRSGQAGSR